MTVSPWHAAGEAAEPYAPQGLLTELVGTPLPHISLTSTDGGELKLAPLAQKAAVFSIYPGTTALPEKARDPDGLLSSGCTLQSTSFRDYALQFAAMRVRVYGVSTSPSNEQATLRARERLPFELLSDPTLRLARELGLPTSVTADGARVYDRLGLFVRDGVIEWAFHPVPIPRRLALDMLVWLTDCPGRV